jgi:hypothetical protein
MAPIATDPTPTANPASGEDITALKARLQALKLDGEPLHLPPDNTLRRYAKAGIDLSGGYPYFPPKPEFVGDVKAVREDARDGKPYVDPATRADKEKKALFGAAKEVRDLTTHIGVSLEPAQNTRLR